MFLQHVYRQKTLSWCVIFCWIRRIYQLLSACCQLNIKDSDWGQRFFYHPPIRLLYQKLFILLLCLLLSSFLFFNLFTLFLVTEVKLCNGRSAGCRPTTEGLSAVCVCSGVVPDAGAGGDTVTWWTGDSRTSALTLTEALGRDSSPHTRKVMFLNEGSHILQIHVLVYQRTPRNEKSPSFI